MTRISFPYSSIVLAALIAVGSISPLHAADAADIEVVDPTTGETVSLADIDVQSLSDADRTAIGDQLAEQGIPSRGRGRGEDAEAGTSEDGSVDSAADADADGSEGGRGGRGHGGGRGAPRD